MEQQFIRFLLRWALNSLGLWVAVRLLVGHGVEYDQSQGLVLFFWAGLVLSLANVILKPLVIILSLPAILLTLGLFTLLVNGFMVWIAAQLVGGLVITFWAAVIAGMIVSLINYALTSLLDFNQSGGVRR
jgi:putative membrane protein